MKLNHAVSRLELKKCLTPLKNSRNTIVGSKVLISKLILARIGYEVQQSYFIPPGYWRTEKFGPGAIS
jgi:hypothetical protein